MSGRRFRVGGVEGRGKLGKALEGRGVLMGNRLKVPEAGGWAADKPPGGPHLHHVTINQGDPSTLAAARLSPLPD